MDLFLRKKRENSIRKGTPVTDISKQATSSRRVERSAGMGGANFLKARKEIPRRLASQMHIGGASSLSRTMMGGVWPSAFCNAK